LIVIKEASRNVFSLDLLWYVCTIIHFPQLLSFNFLFAFIYNRSTLLIVPGVNRIRKLSYVLFISISTGFFPFIVVASSTEVEENIERLIRTNECYGCNLFYANLRGASLNSANLNGANLFNAILIGANLNNAKLTHTYMSNANLSKTKLVNADLTYADLNSAHLIDANLKDARLIHTNLSNADLSGANLNDADLAYANLNGADMSGTVLEGVNLNNTQVKETFFLGVVGLTEKQIDDLKSRGAIVETVDNTSGIF